MNEAALRARSLTLADGQVVVPIEDALDLAATPSGEATGLREALRLAEWRVKDHDDLATAYNLLSEAVRAALAKASDHD